MYADGPAALRDKRLRKLEEMGLVEKGVAAHPLVNPMRQPEWEKMPQIEKDMSARAMETVSSTMTESVTDEGSTQRWSS